MRMIRKTRNRPRPNKARQPPAVCPPGLMESHKNMKFKPVTLRECLLAVLSAGVVAGSAWAGEIQTREAWMPAYSVELPSTPVFATLINVSDASDRLLSVRSDGADLVSIRALRPVEGTLREVTLESLELPVGVPVELNSANAWLLLENTRKPVRARDQHTLTLVFERAGEVTLRVRARPVRFVAESPDDLRTDPMQQRLTPRHAEGLDEALRTDPFLR